MSCFWIAICTLCLFWVILTKIPFNTSLFQGVSTIQYHFQSEFFSMNHTRQKCQKKNQISFKYLQIWLHSSSTFDTQYLRLLFEEKISRLPEGKSQTFPFQWNIYEHVAKMVHENNGFISYLKRINIINKIVSFENCESFWTLMGWFLYRDDESLEWGI